MIEMTSFEISAGKQVDRELRIPKEGWDGINIIEPLAGKARSINDDWVQTAPFPSYRNNGWTRCST